MKRVLSIAAMLAAVGVASAQTITTPADAFNAGKDFANTGKGVAGGKINSGTGSNVLPYYSTTAPETANFQGGRSLIGGAGTNKQIQCETYKAPNAFQQQECDAVNFMSKNPTQRQKFNIDKQTDPILTGSKGVINNPGTAPASGTGQVCRTVTQNNPGEYVTETCTTARKTDFSECDNTLGIRINWNYYCPAFTVEGPTVIPGTERVPAQGTGMIPPDASCHVKQPVDVWTCPEGSTGPDGLKQCSITTKDDNGVETTTKTPATWSQGWNEYNTYADKVPTVIENWDNKCADKEARSDLNLKPWPTCEETKPKWCTQGAEARYFDGVPVYRGCWQWRKEFGCLTNDSDYNCGPRAYGNCASQGSTCVQYAIDGKCAITEESYRCEKTPPSTTTRTVCEPSSFCQDGGAGCFSTDRPVDQDFGKAAAMMEASREAGVYGVNGNNIEIFKGYAEECSIKVFGGTVLKSCCGSSGGGSAFTNHALLGAGMTVVGEGAKEAVTLGSNYMYDALYSSVDGTLLGKGLGAMNSWANGLGDGVFNPMFSFYGFQFQFTFANGFQFVAFDPYSFAFQIAVMVITEWLSCDQSEQVMSLKRGENLCVHIGTRCSKKLKIIGTCLEKKETHCCFNSKLAKIVNRQGRAQLGMPMNSCGGFNQAQLQALDFSRIDLSEFIADIVPTDVPASTMSNRVQQTVNQKVQSYYEQ